MGGVSIEGPDGPLTGRAAQRRRLALLALLAAADRGMTRDKLVAHLWPEKDADRARHALSDSVYRINRALGEEAVAAVGDELRLDPGRLPSDLATFEEALEREQWERAVDAYGGPFLDGFHLSNAAPFERWVDGVRKRLARRYADALESLAEERTAAGDLTRAAEAWRRRAAHDRYDSRVAVRLMEALDAAGNRAGALRHAHIHAQRLEEEFGTEPAPEVTALAERLRQDSERDEAHAVPGKEMAPDDREAAAAAAEGVPERPPVPTRPDAAAPPSSDAAETGLPPADANSAFPHTPAVRRALVVAVLGAIVAVSAWLTWERTAGASSASSPSASIAVLPFENLSANEENRFFTDGVTEEILTNLARIEDLRVIARVPYQGSDEPVGEIGQELGVGYVLEGSVWRAGDEVRINVQLVDARTSEHVWADSYDRQLEDLFAVQSEIARAITGELEAELTPAVRERIGRARTVDPRAYEAYLRGLYHFRQGGPLGSDDSASNESLRTAVRFYREAIAADREWAEPWAHLASAYHWLASGRVEPARYYPLSKEAALQALELDESVSQAHASLGFVLLRHDWDFNGARRAYRRAVELSPNTHSWHYALFLLAAGKYDEAVETYRRAIERNPLSTRLKTQLAWAFHCAGRERRALEQLERVTDLAPEYPRAYGLRGEVLQWLGRHAEAITEFRRAADLRGVAPERLPRLGVSYAATDRREGAREVRETVEQSGAARGGLAELYVALGDTTKAFRHLERALERRDGGLVYLRCHRWLMERLGDDPRFRRIVEEIGFPTN